AIMFFCPSLDEPFHVCIRSDGFIGDPVEHLVVYTTYGYFVPPKSAGETLISWLPLVTSISDKHRQGQFSVTNYFRAYHSDAEVAWIARVRANDVLKRSKFDFVGCKLV